MIYDNSFTLEEMMETAEGQMFTAKKRLRLIDAALTQHLDGHSRFRLLGAMAASLGWAVVFLLAYVCLNGHMPGLCRLALLGVSLLLVLSVMAGELVELKYYGAIFRAQKQLAEMRRRVEKAQNTLPTQLQAYLERRDAQWELPLDAGEPINQRASQVAEQLSGMERMDGGFLPAVKTVLYYAACAAWTVGGAYVMFSFAAASQLMEGISSGPLTVMMVAGMVIACIFEVLLARMIWAKTNCEVGNLTLLALAVGPVIFAAAIVLMLLVYAVILLILYAAAVIFDLGAVIVPLTLLWRA